MKIDDLVVPFVFWKHPYIYIDSTSWHSNNCGFGGMLGISTPEPRQVKHFSDTYVPHVFPKFWIYLQGTSKQSADHCEIGTIEIVL